MSISDMQILVSAKNKANYIQKNKWKYNNDKLGYDWITASKLKSSSCANYVCLVLQDLGILKPNQMFYSDKNGEIKYQGYGVYKSTDTKNQVNKYFEIIKVGTSWKAFKQKAKPSDICLWSSHTSIYAGSNSSGDIWYDAGASATNTGKSGGTFTKIHRVRNMNDKKLYAVLRLKNETKTTGDKNLKVIDVSTYNKYINWGNMKKTGVDGAIIKIISKELKPDAYFEKNRKGCHDNKMPWGVYNYTYATTPSKVKSDMKIICDMLDKVDKTYFKLGVWFDIENDIQAKLTKTQNQTLIKTAKTYVESRGYTFGVYCGKSWYESHIGNDCGVKNWWVARYPDLKTHPLSYNPSSSKKPSINQHVIAWQYTDAMNNPKVGTGNNGKADCSILYSYPTPPTVSSNSSNNSNTNPITTTKKGYTGTFPTLPSRGYFKKGDKGIQVKYLQKFLNWYGNYKLEVDGDYGSKTASAVSKFEIATKLNTAKNADGEFGKKCLAKAKEVKK